MAKRPRVIGTTSSCIEDAEKQLPFVFPPSFRHWLLENNGMQVESVSIFPVFDPRDPRKTADSIVREYSGNWLDWLKTVTTNTEEFAHLLPFGSFGTGDYYCFDYSRQAETGEAPVVLWDHETGACEDRAPDFATFVEGLASGQYDEA
jgi:hypothetical protein